MAQPANSVRSSFPKPKNIELEFGSQEHPKSELMMGCSNNIRLTLMAPSRHAVNCLTSREFDCLAAVNWLCREGWPPRTMDLARVLRVRPPSVVEIVRRLGGKGVLERGPVGVWLSEIGSSERGEVRRSHSIFEMMLTRFGMSPEVACRESRKLDRHSSVPVIRAICAYLSPPRTCPHQRPTDPDLECCRV